LLTSRPDRFTPKKLNWVCSPEPVWTFGITGKSLASTRIRGPDRPDNSVVATPVMLPRLGT